jgi:ribosome-associated protein YbcJ (S4-like RNA binding protein)
MFSIYFKDFLKSRSVQTQGGQTKISLSSQADSYNLQLPASCPSRRGAKTRIH